MLINFGGAQCRITAKRTQLSLMEGVQVCQLRLSSLKHITRPVMNQASVPVTYTYYEKVFYRHAKKT